MWLKVGDKVRVVQSKDFPDMVGKIYKVSVVMGRYSHFVCRVIDPKRSDGQNPLMLENEIEKVSIKGQQLVFEFMG